MPFSDGCFATAEITRSFAFSTATASRLLLKRHWWLYWNGQVLSIFWLVSVMNSSIVSTAIFAATSPAAWPPIPSATTKSPSERSITNESSLCFRFRPMSVNPNARRFIAIACSGLGRAVGARLLETASHFRRIGRPPHRLEVTLLRPRPEARLAEDQPGVLQEAGVVRIDPDRLLDRGDGVPHPVREARRGEGEVMLDLRVLGI